MEEGKEETKVPKISRREFVKGVGALVATTATGILLEGCTTEEYEKQPPPFFEIPELKENLEALKGEVIRTSGYPGFVGKDSIWVPVFNPIIKAMTYLEMREDFYNLYTEKDEDSESILMIKSSTEGPFLVPLNPIPVKKYDGKKLEVTGRVEFGKIKSQSGEKQNVHFLKVHRVEEVSSEP